MAPPAVPSGDKGTHDRVAIGHEHQSLGVAPDQAL